MGFLRPATPGFLVTLAATIILAVVSFNVPFIKSIYFLQAGVTVGSVSGNITFGTLGFCYTLPGNVTCSSPRVGYQLDINSLVGDHTSIQIPEVVVKWITYVLFLHIVALILAAGSSLFGLLAHVREFSMSCMSSCLSGVGAAVTLVAFIFDLALFFIAKSRINAVQGGHASIGNAVWLTLAAWLLLFFSGCFYCLGRCCITRRPRDTLPKHGDRTGSGWLPAGAGGVNYEEQMRLDAIKAEADRKARAARGEVGLPAFNEYDPTQPLNATHPEEDDHQYAPRNGYTQAAPGTRTVDDYYNPSVAPQTQNSYPPQPRRQASGYSTQQPNLPTTYVTSDTIVPLGGAPAPTPANNNNAYLAAGHASQRGTPSQYSVSQHSQYTSAHSQFPSTHSQQPSNVAYGQAITHDASPPAAAGAYRSNYDSYADPYYSSPANTRPATTDPYYQQTQAQPVAFSADLYNNTAQIYPAAATSGARSPPQRHYTLGGGGYGDNVVPDLHDELPLPGTSSLPSPRGPRMPAGQEPQYEDQPPVYDEQAAQPPGVWGTKGGQR